MTNEIIDAETEEFNIEISKMRNNPRDGSLRAVVEADYKDNDDIPPYDQEIKLSGSSVNRFAGTILEINDIEDDEVKSDLKSEILKKKKKAEELAKKRQKRINDEVNNFGDIEPEDELEEILAELYREDSPVTIDDLKEDYPRVNKLQDQNRELVIRNGQDLLLTEKGEERAEEILGFDEFDGDVADEAIRQLDDDPLDYYLTAFNRMHKGDHLLKIWELVSALSATCSDRQVHSWAVGSSVVGCTRVWVKKENGWNLQTIRSLYKEYDGQDWKTMGLNNQTLEAEETDIKDVLHHRNQRKLVEIETRSGRTIEGTLDHSFLKEKNGEIVPVSGEELEEGDYIPVLKRKGLWDEDASDNFSEELGYLLGIYLAEGMRQSKNRVKITNEDDSVRECVFSSCEKEGLDYNIVSSGDISIDVSEYEEFEAAKTGSHRKVVPARVFTMGKEIQREVLKGYFDGDGIKGGSLGYTTASKDLGLGISLLLSEFGIVNTHRRRKSIQYEDDYKDYYYRHRIAKPLSEKKFYEEIGFRREEGIEFDEDKSFQQYIDRVPVDGDKISEFLMKHKNDEHTGRNKILNNTHSKESGELGRYKLEEGLNMYDYDKKTSYIRQLEQNLDSDIFWDRIESIEVEDEYNRHRVYDIVAGKNARHFLLGNGAVVHNSGKGKSALKRNLMKIMPDHYVQKITDFTPKAFIYEAEKEGADILNNQVVYFDEVDDMDEVVNLMRSITDQEEDVIEHKMVRDQEAHTLRLKVDSLTVWFTSVETVNDEQLKNRFILTNPDSSSDLDEKVFNHQQKHLHTGNKLDKPPREAPVVKEMVTNIISNTSDLTPIVPFKVNWKQKFNRRLYPYFVTLMGLIAKIHYRNRVIKDGNIYITEADFHMSSLIWDRLIDTTVAQTDDESLRLLESLPENRAEAMSTSDLSMQLTGFSTTKIRDKIKALEETEELNLINKDRGDGNQYIYWAGEDKKRLVDNLPDIIIDRDIVNDMLEKSGIDPEDQIIDSVLASEINIYNRLEERFEDYKDRMDAKREKDELDVEITQPEKIFIEQAKEYEWMGDIDTLEQMSNKMDNAYEIAEQLEEKDIISIDGDNVPHPMAEYDQARQQGLIK